MKITNEITNEILKTYQKLNVLKSKVSKRQKYLTIKEILIAKGFFLSVDEIEKTIKNTKKIKKR